MQKTKTDRLKDYSDYLRIQNYSPATVKSYLTGLRQFLEFRELHKIAAGLNQEQAKQFILYKYDNGAKWQTINNVYSSLRKYFVEVLQIEWNISKIKRPRQERVLPVLISKSEVKKIIESCTYYKYQVVITLLYSTGIRISECLNLRLEHIDGQRKQIFIKKGKGSRDRYVDLPEKTLEILREYYKRVRPTNYLFNSQDRESRLSNRSVQRAVKIAVKSAKIIKRVTCHTFRHCFATHHIEAGTNIVYIQKQMGHKNLKTTARYIRLSKEYHRQIIHPIQSLKIEYLTSHKRSVNYLETMGKPI